MKPAGIIKLSAGEEMKSKERPGMRNDLLFEVLFRIKGKSLPGSGGASEPSSYSSLYSLNSLKREMRGLMLRRTSLQGELTGYGHVTAFQYFIYSGKKLIPVM